MSDSEEVIYSDDETTEVSHEVTISGNEEDSAPSSPASSRPANDSFVDESTDSDDSIIRRKDIGKLRKSKCIISEDESDTDNVKSDVDDEDKEQEKHREDENVDSEEEDEEEEETELRALSPRTRRSITGVRQSYNYSDDSTDIDYESDNEKTTAQAVKSYNDSDKHSEGNNPSRSDVECIFNASSSYASESDNSKTSTKVKVLEMKKPSNRSKSMTDSSPEQNRQSPVCNVRYSEQFENEIKEKLSSTLYPAEVVEKNSDEGKVVTNLSDSDVQLQESSQSIVEIDSSKDTSNDDASVKQTSQTLLPETASLVPQNADSTEQLKKPSPKKKLVEKFVSREFYDKEIRKLDELDTEIANVQNLYNKIGKNLPDGGQQLLIRLKRLQQDLTVKQTYISSLVVEDDDSHSVENKVELKERRDSMSWDQLSAAVNDIKPKYTGRQGMATFNTQKALTVECLKELHGSLENCPGEDVLAEDPKHLKVNLMNHQKRALAWMFWREKMRPRGGILADDMGLGKTLTMISLVLAEKNNAEYRKRIGAKDDDDQDDDNDDNDDDDGWTSKHSSRKLHQGRTLVICPASLVRQWEEETKSKVSRYKLSVCLHHGTNRDTTPKHLRNYDIVVTTYNIVGREHKFQGALFGIKWQRIILDEAHVVRNHKAQSSIAVCELRAKCRWALTGTPIQNKEMDVYALLKFLHCTPFDDLAYWKKWIDKSAGGQQRLHTIMKTLMLRRTKNQLQSRGELQTLPQKNIKFIEVRLDKEETKVYQKILIYSRSLLSQFLAQRSDRSEDVYNQVRERLNKLHKETKEIKSHEILVLLLRLRQICCHAGLIDAMLEDGDRSNIVTENSHTEELNLLDQLNKLTIEENIEPSSSCKQSNTSLTSNSDGEEQLDYSTVATEIMQRNNPVFDLNRPSSKILSVLQTLKKNVFISQDKAIVVSQWSSVLDILRVQLEKQGIPTLSLNGSVPVKYRQDIVSDFNDPTSKKRVLLLSLTAGGVGLNLVGANHLLLIDLHWNPQLEAQAQDRIYRVGQQKNVYIYKFMCKDTVEERIRLLQENKMSLANGVLTGVKSSEGSKLSMDDLKGLFGM